MSDHEASEQKTTFEVPQLNNLDTNRVDPDEFLPDISEESEKNDAEKVGAYGDEVEETLDIKGVRIQDTLDNPELFKQVLENALGATVAAGLSEHMLNRVRTEQKLHDVINRGSDASMGAKIESEQAHIDRFTNIFKSREPATPKIVVADAPRPTIAPVARVARPAASKPVVQPRVIDVDDFDDDDGPIEVVNKTTSKTGKERATKIATRMAVAVGGLAAVATIFGGAAQNITHDGPEKTTDISVSNADQEQSYNTELDFLNTNGRAGNDFNNIPVNTLNDPANDGHFPGYIALKNQYEKSPHELSAELHQIEIVEQAKGHTFDNVPQQLRMQPGESEDAYIARIGDIIAGNDTLHENLTVATLDYIKEYGRTIGDLNQSYASNYMVIENGKPAVKFDNYVIDTDPNDKVIMLSDTEGIRFPCGQPIRLVPIEEAQAHIVTPAPAPVQEAPAPVVYVQQPSPTYIPTITPVYGTPPPIGGGPQWHPLPPPPPRLTPKQTPAAFIANPFNNQQGSGRNEGNTPAQVRTSVTIGGVHEQAHVDGGAPVNRPSGIQAPHTETHVPTPAAESHPVSSGSSTSGSRVARH